MKLKLMNFQNSSGNCTKVTVAGPFPKRRCVGSFECNCVYQWWCDSSRDY